VAEQRGERLAVLAIPADLGVADFCAFLGGYLRAVGTVWFRPIAFCAGFADHADQVNPVYGDDVQ
jgi:hypothetical protein